MLHKNYLVLLVLAWCQTNAALRGITSCVKIAQRHTGLTSDLSAATPANSAMVESGKSATRRWRLRETERYERNLRRSQ